MIDVTLAGRYRLESKIGSGGMTEVWQAQDSVLERPVAVKILHRHLLSNEVFCQQFRREGLAAAALLHPNIVAAYDTGDHEGAPYLVTEYLGGGSLAQLMAAGPLPPARAAAVGAEVCEALAHAHAAGVLHRDLKPSNILFTEGGQVKVADFAVGRAALGGDLTATGALIGTLSYLAPEVLEGREGGPQADLYALGVVLFKALTGRSPRVAPADLTGMSPGRFQPAHPRDLRPDVPKELDVAVARALSPLPEERFADAAEFGRVLRSVAQARPPRASQPAPATTVMARPVLRDEVTPEPVAAKDSFVRSEGRWLVPVVLLIVAAIAVVYGVLKVSGHVPKVLGGGGDVAASPAKAATQQEGFSPGGSYDPPPGDGSEHPELVPLAFDNKPDTDWKTQTYFQANMAGKPGVGVYGDLGSPQTLRQIEVDTPTPGFSATIRWSDDAQTWSPPAASETVDATHTFDVSADGSHRYWMVWLTNLPPAGGGFQAQISEIKALH